jgi:predicted RecA/RadA family phage recombinase
LSILFKNGLPNQLKRKGFLMSGRYLLEGHVLDLLSQVNVTGGSVWIQGGVAGMYTTDRNSGEVVGLVVDGVLTVDKNEDEVFAIGDPVRFSTTLQLATSNVSFPILGVCAEDSPAEETRVEVKVSQGITAAAANQVTWVSPYNPGNFYQKNTMVFDSGWTMIANKLTSDRAAPQASGPSQWGVNGQTFGTNSDLSVIYSGMGVEFTEGGWLNGLRVWVPEVSGTTSYRTVVVNITNPDLPIYKVYEEPVLNVNDWTLIVSDEVLVIPGDKYIIYLDSLNSAGGTPLIGGWAYGGAANSAAPPAQSWNHHSQQNLVRIDKTDLDGTDRSTELSGITPNTTLQFVQTDDPTKFYNYTVTSAVVDGGSFFSMEVDITQPPL